MDMRFFATTNPHKLREASEILGVLLEQIAIDLIEPQALDVEEVVRVKAEDAYRKAGFPVLVEDTGLTLHAWNGLPGALIKWFLDTVGSDGLLRMLGPGGDRRASAKTAVAYHDGAMTHVFVGEIDGTIAPASRGERVFGWDKIFIPDGATKTFAEMTAEEKNGRSMRKLAFERLKEGLDRA